MTPPTAITALPTAVPTPAAPSPGAQRTPSTPSTPNTLSAPNSPDTSGASVTTAGPPERRSGRLVLDLLAVTTLAAGVVHVPIAASHGLDTLVGGGMLVTAFVQTLVASVVWVQPSRIVVAAATLANLGAAVVLTLAHTTGVPVSGLREPEVFSAQAVGVLGIEAVAVAAGLLLLAGVTGPERSRRWLAPLSAAAVLAVAVPSGLTAGTHSHAHGADGHTADGHTDGGHTDGGHGPTVPTDRYSAFTAGMTQPEIDRAIQNQVDWITDQAVARNPGGPSREVVAGIAAIGIDHSVQNGEGDGGHGHAGPAPHETIADPAVRATLATQLDQARVAAMALPTAAAATAAGYGMSTQYLAGIGAHYVNGANMTDGVLDPSKPEILLYGGNGPDAPLVGVSYIQFAPAGQAPEGFAGPNDVWHFHAALCYVGGIVVPVGGDDVREENCAKVGGRIREGAANAQMWMMHAWVVPGWESPWGLFSGENPDLTLAVGEL